MSHHILVAVVLLSVCLILVVDARASGSNPKKRRRMTAEVRKALWNIEKHLLDTNTGIIEPSQWGKPEEKLQTAQGWANLWKIESQLQDEINGTPPPKEKTEEEYLNFQAQIDNMSNSIDDFVRTHTEFQSDPNIFENYHRERLAKVTREENIRR